MNDLLQKIRLKGREQGYEFNERDLREEKSIRINLDMQKFIKTIRSCQKQMRKLESNNNSLKKLKEGLISSVSKEDKNRFNAQIKLIIEESSRIQSSIQRDLDTTSVSFMSGLPQNANLNEQEKRIARNLFGSSVKRFQDLVLDYQSIEADLKSTNQGMILRSAEIVLARKLSPEEQREIVDNPALVQEMIHEKLSGQAHTKLVNAVKDLQERHEELKKLEKSILEVHKLVQELAGLVKLQGEMIDNICDNIASAKEDTISAEEDIFKSKENMIKARKKKCIILIIIIVVLLVIVGPILFKVL